MPSWPSLWQGREDAGPAGAAQDDVGAPGSIVIADDAPRNRVLTSLECLYGELRRAAVYVAPLLRLSKYGLGIALILCVTVIWVASSVWIQYIFGELEFNKPFFLTYFNTTGFCFWNAGYFLSARWRHTPWDEASRSQRVCVEDARLDSVETTSDDDGAPEAQREEMGRVATSSSAQRGRPGHGREPHPGGADISRSTSGTHLPHLAPPMPAFVPVHSRTVSGANWSLTHAALQSSVLSSPEMRRLSPALHHARTPSPQLPLIASANASHAPSTASMPHLMAYGGTQHTPSLTGSGVATLSPPLLAAARSQPSAADVTSGSQMLDNDDVDDESEHDSRNADGELHVVDECRDYSLPTSSASSEREEVVSVMLTDDDDSATAAAAPWQAASRRATVFSSDMLRHDGAGPPPRRRYHQRARRQRIRRYSLRRIWWCALCFCPFWFFANYLFNLSLSITSVASNTILSSTSSIWTLMLSVVLLGQRVGVHQCVAVALCVSGTIMVGLSDKNASGGRNTVGGDIVALLSAFFYAAYTSVLKYYLPDDERFAMGMVFGAVGVLNFFLLWPGLVLLSVTGVEPFAWPTWSQFWPLLMNSLVGTNLSDVLWARSVVLTSPVVATLGLSLTTPLAMVVDAIFRRAHFSGAYIAGAVFVMVGFVLVNLPLQMYFPKRKLSWWPC